MPPPADPRSAKFKRSIDMDLDRLGPTDRSHFQRQYFLTECPSSNLFIIIIHNRSKSTSFFHKKS